MGFGVIAPPCPPLGGPVYNNYNTLVLIVRFYCRAMQFSGQGLSFSSEPVASRLIKVRFLSRDERNQLYANCKLACVSNLQEYSLQGAENICINKNLTLGRKTLFWHAKQKAIASNFKFLLDCKRKRL